MYYNATEYGDFMRAIITFSLLMLAAFRGVSAEAPRGRMLELHSCELYAGGCIVSSEATLGGRYMLQAWNFTGGEYANTDLRGLSVALLQSSSENLAGSAKPDHAVAYLPKNATPVQQQALLAWLKSTMPGLEDQKLSSRIVPVKFSQNETACDFSAGEFVSVKSASMESCAMGGCGEALWYSPRATTSIFTVAVDRASQVSEPLLQLKWQDGGKRSVFLARFGDKVSSHDQYVSTAELCAPGQRLF
jgi:hypothetical protein